MKQYHSVKRNGSLMSAPFRLQGEIDIDTRYVDVGALEAQMDGFLGCALANISLGQGEDQVEICERHIRNYSNNSIPNDTFSRIAQECFDENKVPSTMFYRDIADFTEDIFTMYQLSYLHYILGKNRRMKGEFPSYCCGLSSNNLIVALWEAGILAAIVARSETYDHTYLVVPFFIQSEMREGVVLIDPTSDQLINDPKKKIRNAIHVLPARDWEYRTDWKRETDLYPEWVTHSSYSAFRSGSYDEYLREALETRVVVE